MKFHNRPYFFNTIVNILLLLFVILSTATVTVGAEKSTILTAERISEPILIDGYANESAWGSVRVLSVPVFDGKVGNVDVTMEALYDDAYIYIHVAWPDKTQSDKLFWTYNGTIWIPPQSTEQDIFTIFFNADDSVEAFDVAGCSITCHADRMHTNSPEERLDVWKWYAAYDNAAGYMSDQYLDNTLVIDEKMRSGYSKVEIDITWQAHKLDGTNTGYIIEQKNTKKDEDGNYIGPRYYEPDAKGDDVAYLTAEEIARGEAVELKSLDQLNDGTAIPVNFTVPAYIQERPGGSAGDIAASGVYRDGLWNLELRRKLVTGKTDDIQFDTAQTYRFSIAVNDDARGSANTGIGHGHSISLVAKTLEFGGKGSEEVVQLALIRDYLVSAKAHVNRGENGLAVSTITDALVVFNRIRDSVADMDPDLFIEIRNGFIDSRRDPSIENINQLTANVDHALLTFQGKRSPPEATLGLKILVLWGKFGVYAFIALTVITIYPIYRMLRIAQNPEFRNLSIFMLLVISPIFLEGVGRLGTFLKISFLQRFSFTTNEYITIVWAGGMFIALYMGRIGFNEIDNTLKSLKYYGKELESRMKELKRSRDELESFSYSVSHDLRAPLRSIDGFSKALLEDYAEKLDTQGKDHLQRVRKASQRMGHLIDDLLELSRLARSEVHHEKIDLSAFAQEIAAELQKTQPERQVEFVIAEKVVARGDERLLRVVLGNLFDNAWKFTSERDNPRIEFGVKRAKGQSAYFVRDNGAGFDMTYADKLFEPFQRLHGTEFLGTGIGLPTVRRIIHRHGGRVWAEGKVGDGATFYFTL